MSRIRILAAVAVAVAVALPVAADAAAPVSSESGPARERAFTRSFGACLQQRGSADVVLLLDQSGSLGGADGTDPQVLRRPAARNFARDLGDLAKESGVQINVRVDSFKQGYVRSGDWTTVRSAADLQSVLAAVDKVMEPDGFATEYWEALAGLRNELRGRADSCQLAVWFTDGKYDLGQAGQWVSQRQYAPGMAVTEENEAAIVDKGMASLCARSGPISEFRAKGGYLATVLLENPRQRGDSDQAERLLERLTFGSGACGTPPEPGHAVLLRVADAPDLTRRLAALSGGQHLEAPFSPKTGQARQGFELDGSVQEVRVLADADNVTAASVDFTIGLLGPLDRGKRARPVWFTRKPGGESAGKVKASGGRVEVSYYGAGDRAVRFDMSRPGNASAWDGGWTVVFRASRRFRSSNPAHTLLKVFGDTKAVWANPPSDGGLVVGQEQPLELQFARGSEPAQPPTGGTLSVTFRNGRGKELDVKSGIPVASVGTPVLWTPPAEAQGPGTLVVTLDATIGRTQLMPSRSSHDVQIRPPADFPGVREASLQFPEGQGVDPTEAKLTITGPQSGTGCVWVDTARAAQSDAVRALPEEFSGVTLTTAYDSAEHCLSVPQGQTAELPVSLVPAASSDKGGNGAIVGDLVVMTKSSASGEQGEVVVGFAQERVKQIDQALRLGVLVIAMLLGLGIPALLLMLVRARLARIPVRSAEQGDLAVWTTQVRVDGDRVVDATTGGPVTIARGQLRMISTSFEDTVTELDVDGLNLRAQAWGNPFSVPQAAVTGPVTPLLTDTSTEPAETATLPLALAGHLVAWQEAGDRIIVKAFVPLTQATDQALPEISQQLQDKLDRLAPLLSQVVHREAALVGAGGPDREPDAASYGWSADGGDPPMSDPRSDAGASSGGWSADVSSQDFWSGGDPDTPGESPRDPGW